jgi:hypothetical protein
MRTAVRTAALAASLALTAGAVQAQTLTFEELPTGPAGGQVLPVTSGYGGLTWSNMYVLDGSTYLYPTSGFRTGLVSGTNVAFNGSGFPAAVSSGAAFVLNSGYFTAGFRNDLLLSIVGSLGGAQVFAQSYTLSISGPSLINFGGVQVDRVDFSTSGGVDAVGGVRDARHFALDNLTINASTVPEPGTWALLATGLLAVGGIAARRKRTTV